MLLPVGNFHKSEIRSMAAEIGLRVADKKDSQEICFVTSGKHGEFVRQRREGNRAGEIITTDGQVVGHHEGIESFTIGQRKGLRVAMHEPYFVTAIEADRNRIVIGRKSELGRLRLWAKDANWLVDVPADEPIGFSVQIRYNSSPQKAKVTRRLDKSFEVEFDVPAEGIAPGQLAVVFDNNRVLGGGWIERSSNKTD